LIASGILTVATTARAETTPQGELIFPAQAKHVHGSSVVECPNGDLLACWFYGSGERRANDVVVQGARLEKGARTWSPVFLMADTPNLPDCNPVLFVDAQRKLWLFWIVVRANVWERSLLKYRTATDYEGDGPPKWSWQDVIILKPGDAFAKALRKGFETLRPDEGVWGEYALPFTQLTVEAAKDPVKRQTGWMSRIHPTVLPSGRILLPLYSDGYIQCLMGISDDGGQTWRASLPIVGMGCSQPSVVRRNDGTLLAYLRNDGGTPPRVQLSTSSDDGETWSVSQDTDIPNPGSSLQTIALKDGRWVMVYNDTEQGRHRFALSLSDDEGKTWKWTRHVERGQKHKDSFAYPSMMQSRDGRIHVTYSHHLGAARSIKHVALDADWIRHDP